jgi:hypothetical protein
VLYDCCDFVKATCYCSRLDGADPIAPALIGNFDGPMIQGKGDPIGNNDRHLN